MIPSKEEYKAACERLEELLPITNDVKPEEDPLVAELDKVSNIIEAYEEEHYPIGEPTLEYRGHKGTVRWSTDDRCYYGQTLNVEPHLVSYEGKDLEQLEKDFKEAIETYLDAKDELDKTK